MTEKRRYDFHFGDAEIKRASQLKISQLDLDRFDWKKMLSRKLDDMESE